MMIINVIVFFELQFKLYNPLMPYQFCYWDAKATVDIIIILINQVITLALLIITLRRAAIIKRLYTNNIKLNFRPIIAIHILILLWCLSQLVVNFYSIIVYYGLDDMVQDDSMIAHSFNYAILISIPSYLIQTLIITVCYIQYIFPHLVAEILNFPTYSNKFVQILFIYSIIRIVVATTAILLMATSTLDNLKMYKSIELTSLIIDCGVINVFIILSMVIFMKNLNYPSLKTLKRQYWLMFACSLCRIIVDILHIVVHSTDPNSPCVNKDKPNLEYTFLYTIIGNYVMHFMPIIIILKMYSLPKIYNETLSLLQTQTNDNIGDC